MNYKTFIFARNLAGLGAAGLAVTGAFLGCRNIIKSSQTVPSPTVSLPPNDKTAESRVFAPVKSIKPGAPGPNAKRIGTTVRDGVTYVLWDDNTVTRDSVPTGATADIAPRDKDIIALRKEPLSNGKKSGDSTKWLAVGNGFKAEFRADAGSSAWNRVKIDLDNDKKWDERWDFKSDGSIKRRISPDDDDSTYSVEYHLKQGDTKWIRAK